MKNSSHKLAYGMTPKKAAELAAIGRDETLGRKSLNETFYNFTAAYVEHARQLARSGNKDTARNWQRYFQNAGVVQVLYSHSAAEPSLLKELHDAIKKLGCECHPLDVPNWETDIQAIRHCLEEILKNQTKPKKQKNSSSRIGYERRSRHGWTLDMGEKR